MSSLSTLRAGRLSLYLAAASGLSAVAVAVVCGIGLYSIERITGVTQRSLAAQISFLEQESAFELLLYQKGFVTEYLLTGDRARLDKLEQSRRAVTAWFARARAGAEGAEAQALLTQIAAEYAAYDQARGAILLGPLPQVQSLIRENQGRIDRLLGLCQQFGILGRHQAEATLGSLRHALAWRTGLLAGAGAAAVLASLAVGFLLALRVARPIYELQLQVESAVRRSRIAVDPRLSDRDGLDAIGDHVGALLRKLEETDAAFIEQRRRLVQSEKLSAMGELSAKLAHEILNPLAGMRAAIQVLCRGSGALRREDVEETAAALESEITRIDQLLRRLLRYARPLQPHVEVCSVGRLLDQAVEAARQQSSQAGVAIGRQEDPDLPPLEVDPLLMTQALTNLLANAVQASPPGGRIEVQVARARHLSRDHVRLRIMDQGPGVPEAHRPRLFQPFFTTRPGGNGLGLATSLNIVLEHGGQLVLSDRPDGGPGAVFDVLLPLVR